MGLFDSIFGSKPATTTVKQTSVNTTTVDVLAQIANVIDVTALADAVKAAGDNTTKALDGLMASLNVTQQGTLVAAIADVQTRAQQNELLKKGLEYSKMALLAGGAYIVWRKVL